MKKFLLIPALLIAAAVSASAHCGTCGTGEAHAVKKACPADCAKPCCVKDAAKCDKAAAKCDKAAAKCDKAAAAECAKKEAAAKKACCPSKK